MARPVPSRAELWEQYVTQQRTLREMSRHYRVKPSTVSAWLHSVGIAVRSPHAASKLMMKRRAERPDNKEWLARVVPDWCSAYRAGKSMTAIAERYRVSHTLVRYRLVAAGEATSRRSELGRGHTVLNAATGQRAVVVAEHDSTLTLRSLEDGEFQAAATDWEVVYADMPPLPPLQEPA
ncbi:MAG: hypothetical protein ACRDQ5_17340 [Sciscionella sp.]